MSRSDKWDNNVKSHDPVDTLFKYSLVFSMGFLSGIALMLLFSG